MRHIARVEASAERKGEHSVLTIEKWPGARVLSIEFSDAENLTRASFEIETEFEAPAGTGESELLEQARGALSYIEPRHWTIDAPKFSVRPAGSAALA